MRIRTRTWKASWIARAAGWALAFHVALPSAWAQTRANLPEPEGDWLAWVVGLGLAVVVLITGFLNPKRSHLT